MDRSRIVIVGCGGCGNQQLNTLMGLDVRYDGIFMNTNLSEMENLKFFDRERRCFYISNADGTGKNQALAEKYIKEDAPKFVEMIRKFTSQDYMIIQASMNGGTGSKAITLLSRLTKKFCPEKSINIIATFPDINLSNIDYLNTINTWNDIIQLKKDKIIDSVQFIDNNKSENLQEINIKAMNELNDSFDIVGDNLDVSDSRRIHKTLGYKVILHLDPNIKDTEVAIRAAMKSSMFYVPEKLDCNMLIGNINTNIFNLKYIKETYKGKAFTKFNTNPNKENILIFGGCSIPTEGIELTKEVLKELDKKQDQKINDDDLIIETNDYSSTDINDDNDSVKQPIKSKLSSKELNNLFADKDFWLK